VTDRWLEDRVDGAAGTHFCHELPQPLRVVRLQDRLFTEHANCGQQVSVSVLNPLL